MGIRQRDEGPFVKSIQRIRIEASKLADILNDCAQDQPITVTTDKFVIDSIESILDNPSALRGNKCYAQIGRVTIDMDRFGTRISAPSQASSDEKAVVEMAFDRLLPFRRWTTRLIDSKYGMVFTAVLIGLSPYGIQWTMMNRPLSPIEIGLLTFAIGIIVLGWLFSFHFSSRYQSIYMRDRENILNHKNFTPVLAIGALVVAVMSLIVGIMQYMAMGTTP